MKPENRKNLGKTFDTEPTLTDQSQGHDTDINVIVGKFGIGGMAPGNASEPMYGDFSELPADLRSFIHESRRLDEFRQQLPDTLRDIPLDTLLQMTPEQIGAKLAPKETPKPADEPPKEPAK